MQAPTRYHARCIEFVCSSRRGRARSPIPRRRDSQWRAPPSADRVEARQEERLVCGPPQRRARPEWCSRRCVQRPCSWSARCEVVEHGEQAPRGEHRGGNGCDEEEDSRGRQGEGRQGRGSHQRGDGRDSEGQAGAGGVWLPRAQGCWFGAWPVPQRQHAGGATEGR